ncbi:MAG: cytochrome c biogenesis protein CcdA [Pseudomonadota bacterium]
MFAETISYPAALLAGLLSFFSPCILPLIPAYFAFISGFTLDELTGCENGIRKKVVLSTAAYVLGFSSVFILMGASASYLGSFIQEYSTPIRIIGGVLIMFLGLHLTGWLRFNALEFEKRVHLDKKPIHFMGTFLVGMAFAAGWSPCIGPLLGSILIIAGSKETVLEGIALLSVYSLGLAIPFMAMSMFIDVMLVFLKKATRALKYFNRIAGVLLIFVGLSLVLNKMVFLP